MAAVPIRSSVHHGSGHRADADLTSGELARVRSTLRTIAGFAMARERADHTLQPTALIHDVLIQILSNDRIDVRDEVGFKAWATKAIRHHLIDHVRRRSTATRGGGIPHLHLDEAGDLSETIRADRFGLLQMNEALQWLEEKHPRSAEVVRLRTFGGLDQRETSVRLGVPTYPIITRDGDTPDVARATRAYPTLWILAPDGTVLHEIVGMHDPLTLLTLLRAAQARSPATVDGQPAASN